MKVKFELTMPNVGSWNGKWTGADKKRTIIRNMPKDKADILIGKNFYYNFGDGWGANIKCSTPSKNERATNLFGGYNWMVDSIIACNEIKILRKD